MKYKFKPYTKTEILRNHLNLGGTNPEGERIDINSLYLERGAKPWLGVMGEYHFVRDNCSNWYDELCKIKAGGVTIVSTYLFWIYHEEIEGEFDFSGDLDIRRFVLEAQRAGLDVVLRIGPWVHGECRNGGLPDWILDKSYRTRDNNPEYMNKARIWYEKIFEQVKGLFYKDGGNIISIQIENELVNDAEHIAALKKMAQEIGYDVPLWTATGWSLYGAKLPVTEVLPIFGAYPDAPWEETLERLPLSINYTFTKERNDCAIGVDLINAADEDGWRLPLELFPFVTCEIGGGMQVTHHRRPLITGQDIYSVSLCKLANGNNLIGYYMYKGGTNKIGKLSTFNETKASGYPNDYTTLSYDFQAPVSEFGEIREQYRLTNMLHMFVHDFGDLLAPMETVLSEKDIDQNNLYELRYAMRTDGEGGFVFVNHYQRLAKLLDIKDAVIDTGSVVFPKIDVKGDVSFIMPFNIMLGESRLEYATAQLLCKVCDTYFFTAIPGIPAEFCFADGTKVCIMQGEKKVNKINNIKIVVLSWQEARFARKLDGKLYIGDKCDLYFADNKIKSVYGGSYSYDVWNGLEFERMHVEQEYHAAQYSLTEVEPQFELDEVYELEIGGKRKLKWQKLDVTSSEGYIRITDKYDCAQLYVDGVLKADNFWFGKPWSLPAEMLFGKECYIVASELRDDFYKEV